MVHMLRTKQKALLTGGWLAVETEVIEGVKGNEPDHYFITSGGYFFLIKGKMYAVVEDWEKFRKDVEDWKRGKKELEKIRTWRMKPSLIL